MPLAHEFNGLIAIKFKPIIEGRCGYNSPLPCLIRTAARWVGSEEPRLNKGKRELCGALRCDLMLSDN